MSYLFHTTRTRDSAQKIINQGWLKPSLGGLSFSHDPHFGSSVAPLGYTFVFPEDVIYDKYNGEDVDYASNMYKGAENEQEVATREAVAVSDAIDILPTFYAIRKYGFKYKYPYKDVRTRKEGLYVRYNRL